VVNQNFCLLLRECLTYLSKNIGHNLTLAIPNSFFCQSWEVLENIWQLILESIWLAAVKKGLWQG